MSTGPGTLHLNHTIPPMVGVNATATHSYRIDPLGRQATAVEGATTTNTEAHDILGTPTDLISTAGAITRSADWTPFGTTRTAIGAPTGSGQPLVLGLGAMKTSGVNGTSETRDRIYDPALGRWTGTDPIAAPLGSTFDSTYTYAQNQPGMYADPLGDFPHPHCSKSATSPPASATPSPSAAPPRFADLLVRTTSSTEAAGPTGGFWHRLRSDGCSN